MFRYVTIQRDSGTTPTPDTIDDSINQVGGDFLLEKSENLFDTEFSLAKLKKKSRVKRADVDIIYPSDSSFPEILEPQIILPVSNEVSYVFPETYNPRGGRQNNIDIVEPVQALNPYIVEPAILEPVTSNLILTTSSLETSTLPTSFSSTLVTTTTTNPSSESSSKPTPDNFPQVTETSESSQTQSSIHLIDTTVVSTKEPQSIPTTRATEIHTTLDIEKFEQDVKDNEIDDDFDDYEDWGVVVSVVKSVSESDSSITLIQHQTTPLSKEEPKETTTVIDDITTLKMLTSDYPSTSTKETSYEKEKTTILPPFKSHPFNNSHKNSSSQLSPKKVHPFLNQIKSLNSSPGISNHLTTNGITIVPWNTTTSFGNSNISSPTQSVITTPATAPSLFGRFNFLNKGKRPDFKSAIKTTKSTTLSNNQTSSSTDVLTITASTLKPATKESSFLKSIQSRLLSKRRPFNSFLSKKNYKKSHEDVSDKISNEISVTEKTKTTSETASLPTKSSFSNRFSKKNRPSFRRPSLGKSFSEHLTTTTKVPSSIIEKPRSKRLPSPFTGIRPLSFKKPRPFSNRFFKSHTTDEPTSPQNSDQSSTTTEKQTVGDIIAQLNGESDVEDKPVTLRPKAFKPKSGSSNKIRAKLQAELAEVKKESGNDLNIHEIVDTHQVKESTSPSTPVTIRKFNRESTLQRILPTRISNTERKSLASQRFSAKNNLQSRPRLRSRTKLQTTTSPTTTAESFADVQEETNPETVLTENDIMDKLGLTVVRTEQPDTTIDSEELEVKGIVDIVHDGESLTTSENEVLPTQSPFQVLIDDNENLDESDDHVHDLVHEHHPEIHFRHLKPDLLPEEPRLSTQEIGSGVTIDISDIVDETHSTSNEMFLPTTLPPSEKPVEVAETNEKVPATAQAFLPTVDKAPTGGFLPTVSRASSRFRGSSRRTSATEPSPPSVSQSRRDKVKFRRRNRIESKASSNQETETSRPRESVAVPRTRTRTRTRTRSRVASEKKEDNLEEKEEDEDKKTVPSRRITNPRRLVSRARSKSAPVFRANTSSRPRTSFRNNQRLRVRGGGRRSTEAPETTEITERHAVVSSTVKNDFEDETEKSLEGKFTTVDVEGLEDPATVVEPVHTTEGVDSTLTINIHEETTEVVGSTVTEEVSTLRPKKFKPKFGSATRDKLRERLREQLINNKTKSVEVETSEVNESEDEEKLPTEDSEKDMPDDILTTNSPKFEPKFGSSTRDKLREQLREQLENEKLKKEDTGDPANEQVFDSAFSDFDITSQKEAPTTARISFDKENFIEIEEVSPSQPQRRSQRRISHKTAQGPLVTRVRSRNQLRKRSNNSHLRHRKRSQSYNTINQQIHRVQKQRRGKSASPVFYDPRRRRRQPIKTEPITESINFDDKLFRVGRSTIVDSQMINGPGEGHQTDANILATTSMDSTAEETTEKMATIEEQETSMTDESIVTDPTTVDQFKDTATEPIVEEEENDNVPFKPFLLRSGKKEKSIFKDRYKDNILSRLRSKNELKSSGSNIQNRFSRFRPGLPSLGNKEHDEKVSGPNIDPSKGIQIIEVETHDEQTEKNDTTTIQEKNELSLKQKEKSKFSKHKSNLFSRKKSKVFENVTETTTTFPVTTSQSISQNKTTEKLDISKKPSNIFAHAKRAKFKSKYTQQFGKKRSSLFKHKPSVEKISTESVKPNISLDSDSVTSSNITSTPSNLSSDQTESFSPKPNPPKSSSSPSFPSSPTRKRFKFSTGSKKSPLTSLFNRRNKHKNSQILSRLTTSTTPSEETTLSSAQEEKVESRTTTQATMGRAFA